MDISRFPGSDFKAKDTVEYFGSIDEALQVALTRKVGSYETMGNWNGGIYSAGDRAKLVADGWSEGADKITPHFDAAQMATIETKGTKHKYDVAGYTPSVPRYLAGNPMNMRRKVKASTSKAPMTIVVNVGVSAGVDSKYIIKRGTALACLVMYLSVFRAVNLYITCLMEDSKGGYYAPMVKIGTTPFDLKALAFALCHPGMARTLMYRLLNRPESSIPWAKIGGKNVYGLKGKEMDDLIKPILGLNDDDKFFPMITLDDPMVKRNAQDWVKDYLKEHFNVSI